MIKPLSAKCFAGQNTENKTLKTKQITTVFLSVLTALSLTVPAYAEDAALPEEQVRPAEEQTAEPADDAAEDAQDADTWEEASGTENNDESGTEAGEDGEADTGEDAGEEAGEDDIDPADPEEEGEDPATEEQTETGPEEAEEEAQPEKEDRPAEEESESGASEKKKKKKDDGGKNEDPETEEGSGETAAEPAETPAQTGPFNKATLPRRITNYAVKHFKKIKAQFLINRKEETAVLEIPGSSEEGAVVAKLAKGAVVRKIDDSDPAWIFIEIKDKNGRIVRGYADSSRFRKFAREKAGKVNSEKVTITKLSNRAFDDFEKTTFDELAYDETVSGTREDLVNFALQFLGNECTAEEEGRSMAGGSDYTRTAYAEFGITLPESAQEQFGTGTKIPVVNARPGDLIFYTTGKTVNQVMICISNDGKGHIQAIQASPKEGRVVVSKLDPNYIWRARTFRQLDAPSALSEEEVLDMNEWTLLGECRLTSYCYKCNTPANSAVTASGVAASEWHTVAVDSSVIPLGSKVYIEGYGIFIAEDTGVIGNWCDLYVYEQECALWDLAQVYLYNA